MDEGSIENCVVGGLGGPGGGGGGVVNTLDVVPGGGVGDLGAAESPLVLTPAQQLLQRQLRYDIMIGFKIYKIKQ